MKEKMMKSSIENQMEKRIKNSIDSMMKDIMEEIEESMVENTMEDMQEKTMENIVEKTRGHDGDLPLSYNSRKVEPLHFHSWHIPLFVIFCTPVSLSPM